MGSPKDPQTTDSTALDPNTTTEEAATASLTDTTDLSGTDGGDGGVGQKPPSSDPVG